VTARSSGPERSCEAINAQTPFGPESDLPNKARSAAPILQEFAGLAVRSFYCSDSLFVSPMALRHSAGSLLLSPQSPRPPCKSANELLAATYADTATPQEGTIAHPPTSVFQVLGPRHGHRLHVRCAAHPPGLHVGDLRGPAGRQRRLLPHV
jgi:hypothetical protein